MSQDLEESASRQIGQKGGFDTLRIYTIRSSACHDKSTAPSYIINKAWWAIEDNFVDMSTVSHHESVVRRSTPMPKDYVFVPKGNVYITGNCRKQTLAARQTVYAVVDKNKRTVGLRVPQAVYQAVLSSEAATRRDRASAVQKRDDAMERQFREALKKLYPRAPDGEIPKIVARAMQKRSGRVGRTSKIDVEGKANLAVAAHIRHVHTNYEQLFKQGLTREKARAQTFQKVGEVLKSWRRESAKPKQEKRLAKSAAKPQVTQTEKAELSSKNAQKDNQNSNADWRSKNKSSSNSRPPSPMERRTERLITRRTRVISAATNHAASATGKIGRSLRDDVSDIEESDEFVGSSDGDEWPGTCTDEEDSD